jgi:hypothetical protein
MWKCSNPVGLSSVISYFNILFGREIHTIPMLDTGNINHDCSFLVVTDQRITNPCQGQAYPPPPPPKELKRANGLSRQRNTWKSNHLQHGRTNIICTKVLYTYILASYGGDTNIYHNRIHNPQCIIQIKSISINLTSWILYKDHNRSIRH